MTPGQLVYDLGDIALTAYDSAEVEIVTRAMLAPAGFSDYTGRTVSACWCHRVRRLRDNKYGWVRAADLRKIEPDWAYIARLTGWRPTRSKAMPNSPARSGARKRD